MGNIIEEKIYANALNQSPQLDFAGLRKIRENFDSFKKAWTMGLPELRRKTGKEKLNEFREQINPEKEYEKLAEENIKILLENELPKRLREIPQPPQILYIKGKLPEENQITLAVVGTRKCTDYGRECCERIINGLKNSDIAIISGMALGIDSVAHNSAIKNNLKTTAVLGGGLHKSVLYPKSNVPLAEKIIMEGGCIMSEYPLKMRVDRYTFPQRNRIVAGLSMATLIIEAPLKSGAMITAFMAVDYNRDLMSVPASIFSSNHEGTNTLIKMGAVPITSPRDILEFFGLEEKTSPQKAVLGAEEEKVILALNEPLDKDGLIRKINLPASHINSLLIKMEMRGLIKESGGMIYRM